MASDAIQRAILALGHAPASWESYIAQARKGDVWGLAGLAAKLRDAKEPIPPVARAFLADILARRVKLPRRNTPARTDAEEFNHAWQVGFVCRLVDAAMDKAGRKRDPKLRAKLTEVFCNYFPAATEEDVRQFRKKPKARRRLRESL